MQSATASVSITGTASPQVVVVAVSMEPLVTGPGALTFAGGPVLQAVTIVPIFLNASVRHQSDLAAFYAAVAESNSYFSVMKQYNTQFLSQSIGFGSSAAAVVGTAALSPSINDAAVRGLLAGLIAAGRVAAPTANTYYALHFPPGVTLTAAGSHTSCVNMCSYHGGYATASGQAVFYGVLPDISAPSCACGPQAAEAQNVMVLASKALAGAVTNPGGGLGNASGASPAWQGDAGADIGDLCTGQSGTATLGDGLMYPVNLLWSNQAGMCVSQSIDSPFSNTGFLTGIVSN